MWGRAKKKGGDMYPRDEIQYLHLEDAHVFARCRGWVSALVHARALDNAGRDILQGEVIAEPKQPAHDATLSVMIIITM
jgi:hypothetical protein